MSRSSFRLAPYVAIALLGFALVVTARSADPGPRVGSRARLIDLIAREDERARSLRGQLEELRDRLEAIEQAATQREARLAVLAGRLDALGVLAGTTPVAGPGVVVELRDSTLDRSPSGDPNDLVIHEQDLQAVVNALWAGGAEAVAINGERITARSAVRCVGNTLLLHGSLYAPPYVIEAIGDPDRLGHALDDNLLVERFRITAITFRLGYAVTRHDVLELPAFRGVARPGEATRA